MTRDKLKDMVIDEPVALSVKGVALERESRLPLLLLWCEEASRLLSVPIGPAEASSIIIEMEDVLPPRPLTHDLIAEVFRRHHLRPLRLEIYGLLDGKHLARIVYSKGLRRHTLEVRPSDGVALALRLDMPIVGEASILRSSAASISSFDDYSSGASEILYLVSQPEAQVPRL